MNKTKLTDLEIKEGWLCKDGVKLTETLECEHCGGDGFTAEHDPDDPHIGGVCLSCPIQVQCYPCRAEGKVKIEHKDCKVKSATIWTEVKALYAIPNIVKGSYINPDPFKDDYSEEIKQLLQAISQDPKAYATDIEIAT